MDLNDIQLFTKMVEAKSLTQAADQLGMPKSTLSRRLSMLEEHLGVQLVQRTTRHFSLTDIGMAYYVRCTEILARVADANQFVTDLQDSPRGRIRLSAPPAIAARYLGTAIGTFVGTYPEITVELTVDDRVGNLLDEGIDLAIMCSDALTDDSRQQVRALGKITVMLCASPDYLATHGAPATIQDLYSHALVLFMPEGRHSLDLTDGVTTHEIAPPAHFLADHYEPVRDALVAGAGIGCLADLSIARELASGDLVRVLPEWTAGEQLILAVYPKRQNIPPRLKLFLEHLATTFSAAPWQQEMLEPALPSDHRREAGSRDASPTR